MSIGKLIDLHHVKLSYSFVISGPMSFDNALPTFDLAVNNLWDAFYHAISLDLGILYPNQIYSSPTEFNATIAKQDWPDCNTNTAQMLMGNLGKGDLSNLTSVPMTLYLALEYKCQPLGQAMAAVFVLAFSMLSVIWAVFNIVMQSFLLGDPNMVSIALPSGAVWPLLMFLHSNILPLPLLPEQTCSICWPPNGGFWSLWSGCLVKQGDKSCWLKEEYSRLTS